MSSNRDRERRDYGSTRDRAEKHKSGFTSSFITLPKDVSFFEMEKSVMYIDIIPYEVPKGANNPYKKDGEISIERTFFTHRGVGAAGDTHICLRKTNKQPCPVCEQWSRLSKDPDADEDTLKGMGPKERQLFNVINCKDRDKGIMVWDISYYLFGELLDDRIKNGTEDEGWDTFHHPRKGKTLKITVGADRIGKGKEFLRVTAIDLVDRKRDYDDEIVDKANVLDDLLVILPYDDLRDIMLETAGDKKKDDDKDDRRSSSRDRDDDRRSSKDDDDKKSDKDKDRDDDRGERRGSKNDDWDDDKKKDDKDDDRRSSRDKDKDDDKKSDDDDFNSGRRRSSKDDDDKKSDKDKDRDDDRGSSRSSSKKDDWDDDKKSDDDDKKSDKDKDRDDDRGSRRSRDDDERHGSSRRERSRD